jgi:cytosine deaminase
MARYIIRISVVISVLFMINTRCYSETKKSALTGSLNIIEKELNEFKPNPAFKEDAIALTVVKQALISVKEGSFGIGACLVNEKNGEMVVVGHNELLLPYFRSDKHAEMVIMDKYENRVKGRNPNTEDLTLYSSLEPCPMCTIRLLSANIKKVRYVSADIDGGFVHHMDELPPYWKNQTFDKDYKELQCSPQLKKIA